MADTPLEFGASLLWPQESSHIQGADNSFLPVGWPAYRRCARLFGSVAGWVFFFSLARGRSNRTRPIIRAHIFSYEVFCFSLLRQTRERNYCSGATLTRKRRKKN
nr:hypothetical protein [Pandoravirus aubagnensis]